MLSLLHPLLLRLIDQCLDRRETPGPFLRFCIDHDSELARYVQERIRLEEQLTRDLPAFLHQDSEESVALSDNIVKMDLPSVRSGRYSWTWGVVAALLLVAVGGFLLFDRFDTRTVAISRPEKSPEQLTISEQHTSPPNAVRISTVESTVASPSDPSLSHGPDEINPWWLLMPEMDSVLKTATNWNNLPLVSEMNRLTTAEPDLFETDEPASSSEIVAVNDSPGSGTSLLRELANSNPVTSYVADLYFPSTTEKN